MRSLVKLADICLLYGVEREARDIKLCGEKRLAPWRYVWPSWYASSMAPRHIWSASSPNVWPMNPEG
jgi:hypothetical protein